MPILRWISTAIGTGVLCLTALCLTPGAAAQDPQDTILLFRSGGVDRLMPGEKDEPLREALRMLTDRLAELPRELDAPQDVPPGLPRFLGDVLLSPFTLRVTTLDDAPNPDLPLLVQLTIQRPDLPTAEREARAIADLVAQRHGPGAFADAPEHPGFRRMDIEGGPLYLGAAMFGNEPRLVIAYNALSLLPDDIVLQDLNVPGGTQTALVALFDAEPLQPVLQQMLAHAPPDQAEPLLAQLRLWNLLGERPLAVRMAMAHSPRHALVDAVVRNYAALSGAAVVLRDPLQREHFRLIPADAGVVQMGRTDLPRLIDAFRGFAGAVPEAQVLGPQPVDQALDMFRGMTGVDLQADILAHLGTVAGYYLSETTGGGGLLSTIVFAEVTEPEALRDGLTKLTAFAVSAANQQAPGRVAARTREIDGRTVTSLVFPGLPIPLELSYTIERGYLWAGLSPQAVLAAADHAAADTPGLLDNPRLVELDQALRNRAIGAGSVAIEFFDTPMYLDEGYGVATLAMSALANAVRSPRDAQREPGLLLSTLPALRDGATGWLTIYAWQGDDLLVRSVGDRSAVVTATGLAGLLTSSGGPAVLASTAGALLPALSKARSNAKLVKSRAQLRQMSMALHSYAADHDDQFPSDLRTLFDEGYFNADMLQSPFGPVGDGGGDYGYVPPAEHLANVQFPDRQILIYDRAAYAADLDVPLVYVDGHAVTRNRGVFRAELNAVPNADADFDLPGE